MCRHARRNRVRPWIAFTLEHMPDSDSRHDSNVSAKRPRSGRKYIFIFGPLTEVTEWFCKLHHPFTVGSVGSAHDSRDLGVVLRFVAVPDWFQDLCMPLLVRVRTTHVPRRTIVTSFR